MAAAALSLALWLTGGLDRAEHLTWDWRVQQAARPSPASDSIALVLLDQPSLDWGRVENAWPWPWPREVYTAVVGFCRRGGARTVTFDVLFTEPSLFGVYDDQLLGEVLAARPDNVGACFVTGAGEVTWPIAEVRTGAARLGNVAGHPDADGVVRRAVLAVPAADTLLSSLGLATYELAESALVFDSDRPRVLAYAPLGSYPAYSAAAVIQSELRLLEGGEPVIDPDQLRGKHVFVGFSAPGLLDQRPTPLSRVSPGVVVHATVLDNLLAGRFMTPAPVAAVAVAVLLLSVLAALLAVRTASPVWQVALFVVGLPLPLLLGLAAYPLHVWWPVVPLGLGITLALVGGLGLNWATEGRQRRFLKQAFRHYLSPHVIDRLVDDPSRLQLGGERRTLSIFFSDLAGFTSLGERLDAESLTTLLNLYLSAMTDIILEEGGTLDKYEGDAIIAFWNAPLDQPDHALRAARTAMRCQQELETRQQLWQHHSGTTLSMRIGVHTGPVVVGNLGSRQRFDYTVLGDAANLASRLEGANKVFGRPGARPLPRRPRRPGPASDHGTGRRPGRHRPHGAARRRPRLHRTLEPDGEVRTDMQIHIAGTRGSIAVTARDRAVFGGDTTCLLITGAGGEQVLVDCGSGLPALAGRLGPAPDLLVLLTHYHLDHLTGLPACAALYEPAARLRFAGVGQADGTAEDAVRALLGAPFWPIGLDRMPARVAFVDLPTASAGAPIVVGGLAVRWTPIPHPGGCTAFRIDEPATGASLVVATDAEWDGAPDDLVAGFAALCREPSTCELLICDGQYDGDTIDARRGWGHTSWPRAVDLAHELGVGRLLLTHHDPRDDDATLTRRELELQAAAPHAALARQGQEIDLGHTPSA